MDTHKRTYFFHPPLEEAGKPPARLIVPPVELSLTDGEACGLAYGRFRGWRISIESAISVLEPLKQPRTVLVHSKVTPGMGANCA